MSEKVKKSTNLFFSGVFILTIANIVVKIIGVGLKVPLTHIIGNHAMGYYTTTYDVYVWLYMISTAGIPVAISMMISRSRALGHFKEAKKIYKVSVVTMMIVGAVGTSILFFGSKLIQRMFSFEEGLYLGLMAIAPTLFFICIASALRGYFQGYQYMTPTAISEVIESFGKMVIGIIGAVAVKKYLDSDLKDAYSAAASILGLSIGVGFGTLYLLIKKKRFKEELYNAEFDKGAKEAEYCRPTKTLLKILLFTSIPIMISSSMMSMTTMFDTMIISNRLQSIAYTKEQVTEILGSFKTQVVTFFNMPPVLIYPISAAIVPYLSSIITTGDEEKKKKLMNSSIRMVAIIALPCALGMSVLSEPIIKLLYSTKFVPTSAPLLSIQALSIFFLAMLSITSALLQAHRKERKPIISLVIGSVIKLIASYILIGIPAVNIYGAPIGTFIMYVTIVSINLYLVAKYTHFVPDFKRVFIKPLICALICAAAAGGSYYGLTFIGLSSRISVLAAICIAAVVYLLAIFIFGAVNTEDLKLLPKSDKIISILKRVRLIRE